MDAARWGDERRTDVGMKSRVFRVINKNCKE